MHVLERVFMVFMHDYATVNQTLSSKIDSTYIYIYIYIYNTRCLKRVLIQNSSALHFQYCTKTLKIFFPANTYLFKVNIEALGEGSKYVQS